MQKITKKQLNIDVSVKIKDFLIKSSVFCVVLVGGLTLTTSVFAQSIESISKYSNLEKEIVNQLNQERLENNLQPLKFNPKLRNAAEIKLKDLIKNKYFAHTSPVGMKAWDILMDVGYDYKYAGENLAMKFHGATDVHNAWMRSKKHRENILFDKYTEVAVAIEKKEDGVLLAVEFFGKPMSKIVLGKDMLLNKEVKQNDNKTKILSQINGSNKYDGGTGNLLTQVVPNNKVTKKKNIGSIIPAKLSPDQIMSLNNMALLVVGIVCLILVVNIWVLEKEEERILAEAKKLCKTKEVLVSG
jgi:hypothetical protein